jgi:hypothetical protein
MATWPKRKKDDVMSKVEEQVIDALARFGEATAHVSQIAQALVMTESEMHGVRADIFGALREACAEMRDAEAMLCEAQEALVVDTFGDALEGAGEGGMAS